MIFTFEVMVYIPKEIEPIELIETSILPYWAGMFEVQQRVKRRYVKESGYKGVNVFVKRHKNDTKLWVNLINVFGVDYMWIINVNMLEWLYFVIITQTN